MPVVPGGTVGAAPGLGGGTKGVAESVLYMAGVTTNSRYPSVPQPRLVETDAAL